MHSVVSHLSRHWQVHLFAVCSNSTASTGTGIQDKVVQMGYNCSTGFHSCIFGPTSQLISLAKLGGIGLELSDERLVERFQQGDQQAFDLIIERYEQKVWHLAFRLTGDQDDAFDLAQEAFLKVYRYLAQFRNQSTFSTWLYRIVTNTFYDEMRKRKRRPPIAVSLDDTIITDEGEMARELPSSGVGPEELSLQREVQKSVQAALLKLPDDYRVALILRDLQDHSYEEISAILGLNLGTVKSRISRARLALRKLLQAEEQSSHGERQTD